VIASSNSDQTKEDCGEEPECLGLSGPGKYSTLTWAYVVQAKPTIGWEKIEREMVKCYLSLDFHDEIILGKEST
jgi:hypothetical protein